MPAAIEKVVPDGLALEAGSKRPDADPDEIENQLRHEGDHDASKNGAP
jgi:hypothetical protein